MADAEEAHKIIVVENDDKPVGKRSTRRASAKNAANSSVSEKREEVLIQSSVPEVVPESEIANESLTSQQNGNQSNVQTSDSQGSQYSFILNWTAKENGPEVPKVSTTSSNEEPKSRRARRRANEDNDEDDPFACLANIPKRQKTLNAPVTHVSRASSFNASPLQQQQQQPTSSRLSRNRSHDDDNECFFQIPVQSALFKEPAPVRVISHVPVPSTPTETTSVYKRDSPKKRPVSATHPTTISTEGWLSSTNIPHQPIKLEPDLESSALEKKVVDLFITEVKPMLLTSRRKEREESNMTDGTTTTNGTLNSSAGKNFKGFVKKRNYKAQEMIIGQKFEIIGLTQLKF